MNNPESGNNRPANTDADKWDILPKDSFYQSQQNSQETPENQPSDEEIRQAIIARRREQLKNNPEARRKANGVSKKLLAGALAATILLSGLVVNSVNKRDVLESDYAKRQITEMENVEEVTFYGNVRSNPETTNSQDTNAYTSLDEEVKLEVPDDSKILYYRGDKDPNGAWYGIPADLLTDESFISKSEARRIAKDHDGYVWVNHGNAHVTITPE